MRGHVHITDWIDNNETLRSGNIGNPGNVDNPGSNKK